MKKVSSKILAILLSFAVVLSMMPGMAVAETASSATVYVTICNQGDFAIGKDNSLIANKAVTVVDRNNDGKLDIDETLYATHEEFYNEGAEAGYSSSVGGYGLSIEKLWGNDSGAFGYYVNNASALALTDEVKEGDYVKAFIYTDSSAWSDKYSFFNEKKLTVAKNQIFTLQLNYVAFDQSYNPSNVPISGATIGTLEGNNFTAISDGSSATTGVDGKARLSFSKEGTYYVSARPAEETGIIVPPVCEVEVVDVDSSAYKSKICLNEVVCDTSEISVNIGSTYSLTGYISIDNWQSKLKCSFSTKNETELGVDKSAIDETSGNGATLKFTPIKAGTYSVALKSGNQQIESIDITVYPKDLRGLSSDDLDFYYDAESGEASMLGNKWCNGSELQTYVGESNEDLNKDGRYLKVCTTIPDGVETSAINVVWYSSADGLTYTEINDVGATTEVNNGIFSSTIYPNRSSIGTYYYYAEVTAGTDTITSISNPAVVRVVPPANSLAGQGSDALRFYSSGGYEYSMLGNYWNANNVLQVSKDATPDTMGYNYISADIGTAGENKLGELENYNVTWYYSDTYSSDGTGYTEVETSTEGAAPNEDYGKQLIAKSGNINYLYSDIRTSTKYPADYIDLRIYPDTSNVGTYYYYVVISDGTNTISSVSCQAVVEITSVAAPIVPSDDQILVSFGIEGFGKLSGISPRTTFIMEGSTVADIVRTQLAANGYTADWKDTGYGAYLVSVTKGIYTYGEMTAGPNSGWMYRVNGVAPTTGMSYYTLKAGDNVVLYYTGDYTKDPYSTSGSTQSEPTISITDKDGKDASSMGKVEYDASSNCVNISPSSGYKVSDVKVNGVSKGAVTRLEGIKATDRIEVVFEAASAESETPAVSDQTAKIIAGVQAIKPKVTNTRLKSGIKVYWKKNSSYKVSYYQVYRKTGKNGTYKLIYTTKLPTTLKITNVKNLKKGKTYYYRVRGVRVIDGKKYYTKWSNYTYRKFR